MSLNPVCYISELSLGIDMAIVWIVEMRQIWTFNF